MTHISTILGEDHAKLQDYLNGIKSGKIKHTFYDKTVKDANEMAVHFAGRKPEEILKKNRPNEPHEVREYRLEAWENVTESMGGKVLHTTSKIFDPKNYNISFPERPGVVSEQGDLGKYLSEGYGVYNSIWNYIRENLLKSNFSDPNSVILVFPDNPEIAAEDAPEEASTEFFRPLPFLYSSEEVRDFVDGLYYTIYIKGDHKVKNKPGILKIIDPFFVRIWTEQSGKLELKLQLAHGFGFPPAFRQGAEVEGRGPYFYKSFVKGVSPHWNKAAQRISDADASIISHLYPESYEVKSECKGCRGKGTIEVKDHEGNPVIQNGKAKVVTCKRCNGDGFTVNKGPFNTIELKPDELNPEIAPIIPPKAYISKELDPINILRDIIKEDVKAGFSAINMEILFKSGENQSGIAKVIDRSDLQAFLTRVSNHIFDYVVSKIINYTAIWMYKDILSESELKGFLDQIKIQKPKELNILGLDHLMMELKEATNSNVSSNYLRNIEIELINTRFANNEAERKKNKAIVNLKSFPNRTVDDLMGALAAGAIQKKDFIRNENIDELVNLAIIDDEEFLDLPMNDQIDKLNQIIDERFSPNEPNLIPNGGVVYNLRYNIIEYMI